MENYSLLISIVIAALCVTAYIQYRRYLTESKYESGPVIVNENRVTESIEPVTEPDEPEPAEPEPRDEPDEQEHVSVIHITTSETYPTAECIDEETRELINAGISCIPKLPGMALEIIPILAKTGSGAKEIAEIINRDQPMAARLLRWVNSSFYGLEHKVISLQHAVALLGTDSVRSLVLEDSFGRLENIYDSDGLELQTIWRHAAAVSCTAHHLAKQARRMEPSIAATAGLLHDIGLLIMLIVGKRGLEDAINKAMNDNKPLISKEFEVLGANHQIYGELFVSAWNLPDEIRYAVGRHHNPLMEPFNELVALMWLSDYLASRLGFACPSNQIPECDEGEVNEVLSLIGLRTPLSRYMTESLARDLVNATIMFNVKTEATADCSA